MVVTHWADFNYCFLNLLLKVWICKFFRKEMPHSVLVVTLRGFVKLLFTTCSTNHSFAIFGVILLLFRFAKSKCVGRLPLEYQFISGEFLWRKRIEKNPSLPAPWFIPAIVLELRVVEMLQSVERLSCLSPPGSFFVFSPSAYSFYFFLRGFRQPVTQEADSGGRTGWPASIWGLQGAGAGAFLGHLQQWLKHCHVPGPCPHPATTLAAHGCPSRAEMLPDAGPSVHLKCLTCEESFK